jgi:transposase
MPAILPKVRLAVKQRLLRNLRRCRQAGPRLRYLIVLNLLGGRGAYQTAEALGVHNTTVYRVARRFRAHGEWGLLRRDTFDHALKQA